MVSVNIQKSHSYYYIFNTKNNQITIFYISGSEEEVAVGEAVSDSSIR